LNTNRSYRFQSDWSASLMSDNNEKIDHDRTLLCTAHKTWLILSTNTYEPLSVLMSVALVHVTFEEWFLYVREWKQTDTSYTCLCRRYSNYLSPWAFFGFQYSCLLSQSKLFMLTYLVWSFNDPWLIIEPFIARMWSNCIMAMWLSGIVMIRPNVCGATRIMSPISTQECMWTNEFILCWLTFVYYLVFDVCLSSMTHVCPRDCCWHSCQSIRQESR
jgi:hypothetical protein